MFCPEAKSNFLPIYCLQPPELCSKVLTQGFSSIPQCSLQAMPLAEPKIVSKHEKVKVFDCVIAVFWDLNE